MIPTLVHLLDDAVQGGVFPAAQACVIRDGAVAHLSAHGGMGPLATTEATLFDVSSLTKVIATTSLAFHLLSRGDLHLEDQVGRWFPRASVRTATIRNLLAHTSGLPPWEPLFARVMGQKSFHTLWGGPRDPHLLAAAKRAILEGALETPPETPPGRNGSYSDLGFLLLGEILERVSGAPLDVAFQEAVARPLGLQHTAYRPLDRTSPRPPSTSPCLGIAPTGLERPRPPAPGQGGRYPSGIVGLAGLEGAGEVDDDNAWAMGGVAGHAGLFSTAEDVARWGAGILEELDGAKRLGEPSVLAEMVRPDPHPGTPRALGFDVPSGPGTSLGNLLGRRGERGAVGHLGFTGCSVWIDLDRRWVVAHLSNRVYPSRGNAEAIRHFRPSFHDEVALAWETKD